MPPSPCLLPGFWIVATPDPSAFPRCRRLQGPASRDHHRRALRSALVRRPWWTLQKTQSPSDWWCYSLPRSPSAFQSACRHGSHVKHGSGGTGTDDDDGPVLLCRSF